MSKRDKVLKETRDDLKKQLETYGRCCLLRCTGFGKTWLVSSLVKDYKKVLYVYPSEVIKNTAEDRIKAYKEVDDRDKAMLELTTTKENLLENVNFVSYQYLSLNFADEEKLREITDGVDLIIFDECHCMGGPQVKQACYKIFELKENPKETHIVGVTATIERMDRFDVIGSFFCNVTTYSYTLHDAIQDGLIKKPIYCYCTHQKLTLDKNGEVNIEKISEDILEAASMAGQLDKDDKKNPIVRNVVKARAIEIATIYNMPKIMNEVCTKYGKLERYDNESDKTIKYMKFLCFMSDIETMKAKIDEVIAWFQEAFPKYTCNILIITSETREYKNNVHKLDDLKPRDNVIDLIFSVDMLNLGYHVTDITGVLMNRATSSNTVFVQQLGRALSTGSAESCVVFDVVDNLHRRSLFNVHQNKNYVKKKDKREVQQKQPIINHNGERQEIGEYHIAALDRSKLTKEANETLDKLMKLTDEEKSWIVNPTNDITSLDLIATGHEALYRELISKAVVYTMVRRVMSVLEHTLYRWCAMHGIGYPCNKADLIRFNAWDEWKEYIDKILKEYVNTDGKERLPLFDAEKLMRLCVAEPILGFKGFMHSYDLTINQVMDILAINN